METQIIETLAITDKKVFTRVEDAKRHAELARNTAKTAREKGREDIAQKLEADAAELENLAATWSQDILDDQEEENSSSHQDAGSTEGDSSKNKTKNAKQGDQDDENENGQADGDEKSNEQNSNTADTANNTEQGADNAGLTQSGGQVGKQNAQNNQGNQTGDDSQSDQSGQTGNQESTESDNETSSKQAASQTTNQAGEQSSQQQGLGASSSQISSGSQSNGQSGNDSQSEQSSNDSANSDQTDNQSEEQNKNSSNDSKSELNLDGSDGGNSSNSDNDQIKDIFGMMNGAMPQAGQMGQPNGGGQRDPTLAEIKQMLGKLSGEAKRGALDGIRELLKDKATTMQTESLCEKLFSKDNIREIDDDEWADKLNSIIKTAQELGEPIKVLSQQDKINNLNNIKQMTNNQQVRRDLEREANVELIKDYQKKKALDNEGARYKNYRSIEQFKINFYNAIKDQVDLVKKQFKSYNEINPEADDDRRIDKEISTRYQPDVKIPVVNLYFDRSGSWNDGHSIEIGKQIVATVQEFADAGEIELNVLYFDDYVTPDEHDAGLGHGGTNAWNDIIQNIIATKANNVVLMTDRDMEGDAYNSNRCTVEGCVWFVWRLPYPGSTGGQEIPKKLVGKEYNGQFAFSGR